MKIAHIALCLLGGGIQNFLLSLAKEQVVQGHSVSVISLQEISDPYEQKMIDTLRSYGVDVHVLNKKLHNKASLAKTLMSCRRLVGRLKPDVVNTHGELCHLYGAFVTAGRHAKHVITVHNAPEHWDRLNRLVNSNKPVIFCSRSAYELREQTNQRRHVIPNGISADAIKTDAVTNLRKEYGLSPSDTMIVLAGSLRPQKNYPLLLEISQKLADPSVHFFICGGHYGTGYIDRSIFDGHSNIHLLGLRSDVSAIENEADIFMSCATFEGLPIAVLEAYFNGIPCILSPIIQHKQIADVPYVEIPDDFTPEAYCRAINKMRHIDLSHDEIFRLREEAISKYSITNTCLSYTEAYNS